MPEVESFLPLLPPGLRAFALYVQAHYLYLKEEYARSAGIVEATLALAVPVPFVSPDGQAVVPFPAVFISGAGKLLAL